jgi:hypothetical protein
MLYNFAAMAQQEWVPFLEHYLAAVIGYWKLFVLDGVLAGVDGINWWRGKELRVPKKYIVWLFFAALIGAQMFVYRDLKGSTEGLSGSIVNEAVAQHADTGTAVVPMELTLANTGNPTAVTGFQLSLTYDGVRHPAMSSYISPAGMPIHRNPTGELDVLMKPEDQISEKARTPLPTGGILSGWVVYDLIDIKKTDIFDKAVIFDVVFWDVYGHEYHARTTGKRNGMHKPMYMLPGDAGPLERTPEGATTP